MMKKRINKGIAVFLSLTPPAALACDEGPNLPVIVAIFLGFLTVQLIPTIFAFVLNPRGFRARWIATMIAADILAWPLAIFSLAMLKSEIALVIVLALPPYALLALFLWKRSSKDKPPATSGLSPSIQEQPNGEEKQMPKADLSI